MPRTTKRRRRLPARPSLSHGRDQPDSGIDQEGEGESEAHCRGLDPARVLGIRLRELPARGADVRVEEARRDDQNARDERGPDHAEAWYREGGRHCAA
jgi:hypothetical protein